MTFFRELWRRQQGEKGLAYTPADVLCHAGDCQTRKGGACDCYTRLETLYGPKGDMSVRRESDEAEARPEASDASERQPAPSTHASSDWAGAHLRAAGLLRRP